MQSCCCAQAGFRAMCKFETRREGAEEWRWELYKSGVGETGPAGP
jgi:hypothetical protein